MENKPFSFDTIDDFDHHIDLSIPDYSTLIKHILNISKSFVKSDRIVYDFGASTGKLLELLDKKHKTNTDYIGIDRAVNLTEGSKYVINGDINKFVIEDHCLSLLIFTLQFLSIEERESVLWRIYQKLDKGGALIVAEKTIADEGLIQDLLTFAYYDFKRENFTGAQIFSKQEDLRYIMAPLTECENYELFRGAGFTRISSFWSSLSFKAWILIK